MKIKQSLFALLFFIFPVICVHSVTMVTIPGLGDVGYEKIDDSTYSFGIPAIGTFEFKGVFNSISDFDLYAEVPVSAVTDYIPAVGQILGVLGLDTTTTRITPQGYGLKIHMEEGGLGMFREYIVEELWLYDWQATATEALISSLEVKRFDMETFFRGKSLYGSVSGDFSVIGMEFGFSEDGDLSFEAIIRSIIDEMAPSAIDFVGRFTANLFNDSKEVINDIGEWGLSQANSLIDEVGVIAHDVSASISHGSHNFDKCYNECTVNYANSQRNKMFDGGNRIFQDFYNRVYRDLRKIEGENEQQTLNLRKQLLDGQWFRLVNNLNSEWQNIYDDDEVENYFFRDSSERQARERYRNLIRESWDRQKAFTDKLYNQLMVIRQPIRNPRSAV